MSIGEGRYTGPLLILAEEIQASDVCLIVGNGNHGPGFSVMGGKEFLDRLPGVLLIMAMQISRDLERGLALCDECGHTIPTVPTTGGMANKYHLESCSLYDKDKP